MADNDELFALCYKELHRLAHKHLRNELSWHTLQTTDVLHEVYKKFRASSMGTCKSRAHFFAIAARAMRQVLVDYARRKKRKKHGGGLKRVTLDESQMISIEPQRLDILVLHMALVRLAKEMPHEAEALEWSFFGGMKHEEIAEVQNVSTKTVQRRIKEGIKRLRELM